MSREMFVEIWCSDKKRATPKDLAEREDWRGRSLGEHEFMVMPRIGETIDLGKGDEDICTEVTQVVHGLGNGTLMIEVEWVDPADLED